MSEQTDKFEGHTAEYWAKQAGRYKEESAEVQRERDQLRKELGDVRAMRIAEMDEFEKSAREKLNETESKLKAQVDEQKQLVSMLTGEVQRLKQLATDRKNLLGHMVKQTAAVLATITPHLEE